MVTNSMKNGEAAKLLTTQKQPQHPPQPQLLKSHPKKRQLGITKIGTVSGNGNTNLMSGKTPGGNGIAEPTPGTHGILRTHQGCATGNQRQHHSGVHRRPTVNGRMPKR